MVVRLILLSLILGISSGIVFEQAEGFIEFKKYKGINSPKVCGDKMCSEIDEERAKKGLSSRDIKICGDRPCSEVSSKQPDFKTSSPYGQYMNGTDLDLIQCNNFAQKVVIKKTTLFPACVDAKNVEKLREKGWAITEKEQEEMFKEISKIRQDNEKLTTPVKFTVFLSIIPEEINNQRYLMFEGDGWHRLHNVEITISDEVFTESVRTKTDDRGHLNMPWPIPDTIGGKPYRIFATDGIHDFEISIPIARNSD